MNIVVSTGSTTGEKMAESSIETKKKLLESAKKEFLEKGFMNASLRTIAANAGVTTGAMYRHFKDKDAFFCALVDDVIDYTTNMVMLADTQNHALFDAMAIKKHMESETEYAKAMIDYMYDNFDAFTLLLTKSAGSTHEHFQDEICDLYTKNFDKIYKWMYKNKIATKKIPQMTVHVIASTVIHAYCEIILHKMDKKDALEYMYSIIEFTNYGCMYMMGIQYSDIK